MNLANFKPCFYDIMASCLFAFSLILLSCHQVMSLSLKNKISHPRIDVSGSAEQEDAMEIM